MKRMTLALFILLVTSVSSAASTYYPTDYKNAFRSRRYQNELLKEKLFELLSYQHIKRGRSNDLIARECPRNANCYEHKLFGYNTARAYIHGNLHLEEDRNGYYIKDVYCRFKVTEDDADIGPGRIPNHRIINVEHTWPKSRFTNRDRRSLAYKYQVSDLHHLFPADSLTNTTRNSFHFGEGGERLQRCPASRFGNRKFEPPTEHKGNIARAMFYFSVRYKAELSRSQERLFRSWHELDPVDGNERERNNGIYKLQGVRNPFIDYPRLVSSIRDF